MKRIIMIKSIFDNSKTRTLEESFNPITIELTNTFFSPSHPFGKMLRKKVFEEEIDCRRIRFFICKYDYLDDETMQVYSLMLDVVKKDEKFLESPHDQMQNIYINGKLGEFLNGQCFNVPCKDTDETERFLNYLGQYVPDIWVYFKVVEE